MSLMHSSGLEHWPKYSVVFALFTWAAKCCWVLFLLTHEWPKVDAHGNPGKQACNDTCVRQRLRNNLKN
eukprot:4274546-Amphidinium_carterae.1